MTEDLASLNDLLNDPVGRAFLSENGVFDDPDGFLDSLKPPAHPGLERFVDTDGGMIVYSGQQVYADYPPSVLSKLSLLKEFEPSEALSTFFVWMDTDRAGSDKQITTIVWHSEDGEKGVRVASAKERSVEARFVELDPDKVSKAFLSLEGHILNDPARDGWNAPNLRESLDELGKRFSIGEGVSLAQFDLDLGRFMLERIDLMPRSVVLSDLYGERILTEEVELCLQRLDRVIEVFNDAVEDLERRGIDPLVHPLTEDYLPLAFACVEEGNRIRLVRDGEAAVGRCECGKDYRFELGSPPSIAEIIATGRWSLDVSLPLFLNDLASGIVGGQSSAVYGLVLNRVLEDALGKSPIPVLVPNELSDGIDEGDTLLRRFVLDKG